MPDTLDRLTASLADRYTLRPAGGDGGARDGAAGPLRDLLWPVSTALDTAVWRIWCMTLWLRGWVRSGLHPRGLRRALIASREGRMSSRTDRPSWRCPLVGMRLLQLSVGSFLLACAEPSTTGPENDSNEPPVATKLAFVAQPGAASGSEPMTPAVQVAVQDASGKTVATATQAVTVALEANPAGGTLSGTRTVTPIQGIATFADLRIGLPGSGYTLGASAPGLTGATSAPFGVTLTFAAVSGNIGLGGGHTCGLTAGGAAYCWGNNQSGQLGDGTSGTSALRTRPVAVQGGLRFSSLSAGEGHNCGIASGGAMHCWGANFAGQLGDGTTNTLRTGPVAVLGGLSLAALSAGAAHTCGVTTHGVAYCWGSNFAGQLGDGTTTDRPTPVAVLGGLSFAAVSAGEAHTCGVTTNGAAYCWGRNYGGQLGDSTTAPYRASPVLVSGGITFAAVSAGQDHTCARTSGGVVYCWGGNHAGALGDGTTNTLRTSPVAVLGGLTFATVSAGGLHTCGVTTGGAAYCWGDNGTGQLGDGTTSRRTSPVRIQGGLEFASVSAAQAHTCGVTPRGAAYCWGANQYGQLGIGTTGPEQCTPATVTVSCSTTPVAVKAD
jgi:alpha-tubulin suppressor-like RCC1 family protein